MLQTTQVGGQRTAHRQPEEPSGGETRCMPHVPNGYARPDTLGLDAVEHDAANAVWRSCDKLGHGYVERGGHHSVLARRERFHTPSVPLLVAVAYLLTVMPRMKFHETHVVFHRN
jgi:hypothetical protein